MDVLRGGGAGKFCPGSEPVCLCVLFLVVQEQQIQKLKNEKLKIAMMKLKEASVHKVRHSQEV